MNANNIKESTPGPTEQDMLDFEYMLSSQYGFPDVRNFSPEYIAYMKDSLIGALSSLRIIDTTHANFLMPYITLEDWNNIQDTRDKNGLTLLSTLTILSVGNATFDDFVDYVKEHSPDTSPAKYTYNILMYGKMPKEEEIIAHPEFFNPEVFSKAPMMWYSKETMKLLNQKYGGRKFGYKKKSLTLPGIIRNRFHNKAPVTYDDFMYLLEHIEPKPTVSDIEGVLTRYNWRVFGANAGNIKLITNLLGIKA